MFPLYDSLSKSSVKKDLTTKQKNYFISNIEKLDIDGIELIYSLIKIHEINTCVEISNYKLPFQGVFVSRDMQFDLNIFPNILKHILYNFLLMHLKSMEEKKAFEIDIPINSSNS